MVSVIPCDQTSHYRPLCDLCVPRLLARFAGWAGQQSLSRDFAKNLCRGLGGVSAGSGRGLGGVPAGSRRGLGILGNWGLGHGKALLQIDASSDASGSSVVAPSAMRMIDLSGSCVAVRL